MPPLKSARAIRHRASSLSNIDENRVDAAGHVRSRTTSTAGSVVGSPRSRNGSTAGSVTGSPRTRPTSNNGAGGGHSRSRTGSLGGTTVGSRSRTGSFGGSTIGSRSRAGSSPQTPPQSFSKSAARYSSSRPLDSPHSYSSDRALPRVTAVAVGPTPKSPDDDRKRFSRISSAGSEWERQSGAGDLDEPVVGVDDDSDESSHPSDDAKPPAKPVVAGVGRTRVKQYDDEGDDVESRPDSGDSYTASESGSRFIAQAERAMSRLKEIEAATDWKRALKHKSGVVSYLKKDAGPMGKKHPIFKGEGLIKGYSPQAVFAVVGTRKLWDEWYAEGNLVENLNDTTSLTYMCMQGIVGSTTRDLSLVEKVEGTPDGTIYFCATSVDTPKVPKVQGRVRATIGMTGWILSPYRDPSSGKPSTKVSYVLQVNVKTFWPAAISVRYMARRPVCIARIDDYLQKNGAPPMAGVDPEQTHPGQGGTSVRSSSNRSRRSSVASLGTKRLRRQSTASSGDKFGAGGAAGAAAIGAAAGAAVNGRSNSEHSSSNGRSLSRKPSQASVGAVSNSSKKSRGRSNSVSAPPGAGLAALLAPAPADESSAAHKEVLEGVKKLKGLLNDKNGWSRAQDWADTKIYLKNGEGDLPITKTEASVVGVTTEQVLATINSTAARRIWNAAAIETIAEDSHGFHDGVFVETIKGVYPYLQSRKYVVAKGTVRTDKGSDHGEIFNVARSIDHDAENDAPGFIPGEVNVLGFHLVPQGDDGVLIRQVSDVSINNKTQVPPHVKKVMIYNHSTGPRALAHFIDQYGPAPYFIRWGEGDAALDSDNGDIQTGEMIYRIKPGSGRSSSSGPQKAWFQYSDRSYPSGIAFTIEPRDAITVAQVAGMERTLEFGFAKLGSKGAIIRASKGDGRSPDDVRVNGKTVIDTVEGARTAGGSRRRGGGSSSAAVAGAGAAAGAAVGAGASRAVNDKPQVNGIEKKDAPKPQVNGASTSSAASRSTVRDTAVAAQEKLASAVGPKVATQSGEFPPDTMIIITKDLYFNQGQVFVILFLLGASFFYGRFF